MKQTIKRVADAAGVSTDTVRYYERTGLLAPLNRTVSGYRVYDGSAVKRLKFVRRAQTLGFTLAEIKDLLNLSEKPETDCADIRDYTRKKIAEIESRIVDMKKIIGSLKQLENFCPGEGKPLSECNILQHYYGEEE